jgi:hypothetical protein
MIGGMGRIHDCAAGRPVEENNAGSLPRCCRAQGWLRLQGLDAAKAERRTQSASGNFADRFAFNQIHPQDDVMAPKRNRAPRDVPDSLPKDDSRSDVLPDNARGTDNPQSPSPTPEEAAPDGGLAQHPIHDDDLEDRDSADYERDIDQIDQNAALDVVLRKQD